MTTSLHLCLVRHGQTAWNVERRVLGRTDISLDDTGRHQAGALARVVGPFDAVWASPLLRARETAGALIRGAEQAVRIEAALTEMDQGELDGLGETEMIAQYGGMMAAWRADPEHTRLPMGETMGEVRDRALAGLERIASQHASGRVIVVTHQLTLAATLCTLSGEPLTRWRSYTHPNTAWADVEWHPDRRVLTIRNGPHLA